MVDIEFGPQKLKLCNNWLTGYSISNAIVQSTAILIIVLNLVIVTILKCKLLCVSIYSAFGVPAIPHHDRGEGIEYH